MKSKDSLLVVSWGQQRGMKNERKQQFPRICQQPSRLREAALSKNMCSFGQIARLLLDPSFAFHKGGVYPGIIKRKIPENIQNTRRYLTRIFQHNINISIQYLLILGQNKNISLKYQYFDDKIRFQQNIGIQNIISTIKVFIFQQTNIIINTTIKD